MKCARVACPGARYSQGLLYGNYMGPGAAWRAGDPLFFSSHCSKNLHPDPRCPGQRKPRTPPTDASLAARAGRRRAQACGAPPGRHRCEAASVGYAHAPGGEATMAGRGAWRLDGGARRVEIIAPSSPPPVLLGCRPTFSPPRSSSTTIALQCADASLLPPCPSGRCWRRRRHRTCVHRRARWCAPPWGTQRRTRHRRMTVA